MQIDGLSGTGKSSLAVELTRRGYCAVDSAAEFAHFGDPVTGRPTDVQIRDNWIWDLLKLRTFVRESSASPVFICGGALNQEHCADLFTHRFMLRIDDATMRHRLLNRRTNDFGKTPEELAEQLELNRRAGVAGQGERWVIVDATRTIAEVADNITQDL